MPSTTPPPSVHALRVSDLSASQAHAFEIVPDPDFVERIKADLALIGLRKVRFSGTLSPHGKTDWLLTGRIGATVVQPCTVSLEPVTTRIDANVRRLFVAGFHTPEGDEIEMPEDDDAEPLEQWIDPSYVMREALAIELPLYPRASGTDFEALQVTEPGAEPLTDEAAKPFAGLAELRNQLNKKN